MRESIIGHYLKGEHLPRPKGLLFAIVACYKLYLRGFGMGRYQQPNDHGRLGDWNVQNAAGEHVPGSAGSMRKNRDRQSGNEHSEASPSSRMITLIRVARKETLRALIRNKRNLHRPGWPPVEKTHPTALAAAGPVQWIMNSAWHVFLLALLGFGWARWPNSRSVAGDRRSRTLCLPCAGRRSALARPKSIT